jgi:hypothetical protein
MTAQLVSVMVPAPFLRRALPDKKCTSAIVPSVLLLGIKSPTNDLFGFK